MLGDGVGTFPLPLELAAVLLILNSVREGHGEIVAIPHPRVSR